MIRIIKKIQHVQWKVALAGLVLTLAFCCLYVIKPAYFQLLENKLYDVFISQTHKNLSGSHVTIVDIDEYSIQRFGQWPWPRYRVALLLKKIQAAGALVIGCDILFGEPDATSPGVLQKNLKQDLQLNMGFTGLPPELMDNDQLFADVLGTGPFVLGYFFYFQKGEMRQRDSSTLPALKVSLVSGPGTGRACDYLVSAQKVIPPLSLLLDKASGAGYMNAETDRDGVLRSVPLMIDFKGHIYPHLSLATLLAALKGRIPNPIVKMTSSGIESMKIGDTIVPLSRNGAMLINYKGPGFTYPFVPAARILEDEFNPETLQGKVVFVGSSAAGLMDIRVSPLDENFPGVEVNATVVDNILNQDFIRRPDWAPGLEFILILAWGLISTLCIGWADARLTLPVALVLGGVVWYGGIWSLKEQQTWVSPFFPMLVLMANFSVLNLFKFWFSEKKKKFYRTAFSKYVSKAVVDQIIESPEKMSLAGEEKEMSIMFADIRNFSTISESLTSTQVTMLLNDYFTPMTKSIIKHQGTLDKFIGDAVMCFWNAPLDVKNHQEKAVRAGFEMLNSLEALNKKFKEKFGIQIDIGIGIHSGRCRVGNMGTADLFDYTLIGDNVNLASRLEGLTKYYGVRLIVSQSMAAHLPATWLFQELDQVRVKGKIKPVGICTVFLPEKKNEARLKAEIDAYEKALYLYKNQRFLDAEDRFNALVLEHPYSKIHAIYRDRCTIFLKNPPEYGWDGVFTHTTK